MRGLSGAALILCAAGVAGADPLADMAGTWRGAGWARETPQGPQETVRCRMTNTYDVHSHTLEVSGQCAVPGRRLKMSGEVVGQAGRERLTGRWSNPDGIGSVRIVGIQRDGIVAFTFTAKDPATGRNLAQNIEWRVMQDALQLRSTDRDNPDIQMSDITFTP